MFCPNCGANNNIEQNFCRFCSLNLQETNVSLAAQLSSGQNAAQLKKLERIRTFSDIISFGLTVAIATGILIFIYTALTGTVFFGAKIFWALIIVFAIIESVLLYVRYANTPGYADEMDRKSVLAQNEPGKRETAKLLEDKPFEPATSVAENSTELRREQFEPVPGVAGNATDLLYVERKTRKLE